MRKHKHITKDVVNLTDTLGIAKIIVLSKSSLVNQDVGSAPSYTSGQILDVDGNAMLDVGGNVILDVTTTSGITTEIIWTWDGESKKDDIYYHSNSVNPSRVEVNSHGWYAVDFIGSAKSQGAGSTTLQGMFRINGGTTQFIGSKSSTTAGSAYGNSTPALTAVVELQVGDYVEVGTNVEASDATYVLNTSGTGVNEDSHIFTVKKVAL